MQKKNHSDFGGIRKSCAHRCAASGVNHRLSVAVRFAEAREHEEDEDDSCHERDEREHDEDDADRVDRALGVIPLFRRCALIRVAVKIAIVRVFTQTLNIATKSIQRIN